MKANENGNYQGLHIVVITPADGRVVLARAFDTAKSSESLEEFVSNEMPSDFIVVAACQGECVAQLSQKIKHWFSFMGSQEIWKISHGMGFCFIGSSVKRGCHEKRADNSEEVV